MVYNLLARLSWQIRAQDWAQLWCSVKYPMMTCWEATYSNVIILRAVMDISRVWPLRSKGWCGCHFYLHTEEVIKTRYFNDRPECLKLLKDIGSYFYSGICQTALPLNANLLEFRLNYCLLVKSNWESITQLKCHLLYAALSDCNCQNNLSLLGENNDFYFKLPLCIYMNQYSI